MRKANTWTYMVKKVLDARDKKIKVHLDKQNVTPQDPLQGRDGHFTPQTRRLKV